MIAREGNNLFIGLIMLIFKPYKEIMNYIITLKISLHKEILCIRQVATWVLIKKQYGIVSTLNRNR